MAANKLAHVEEGCAIYLRQNSIMSCLDINAMHLPFKNSGIEQPVQSESAFVESNPYTTRTVSLGIRVEVVNRHDRYSQIWSSVTRFCVAAAEKKARETSKE